MMAAALVFADAGLFVALFNRSDHFHDAAKRFLRDNRRPLVTSLAHLTETLYLLDFSSLAQVAFLRWIAGCSIRIEAVDRQDLDEIANLIERYSDVPMDFADACAVYLCAKLQLRDVASFDKDFVIYRLPGGQAFKNLLDEAA